MAAGLVTDRFQMVGNRPLTLAHHSGDLVTAPALTDQAEDLLLADAEIMAHWDVANSHADAADKTPRRAPQ